jgi:short-subunit dehydrogenase
MKMTQKVILITGASSGIGHASAKRLIKEGHIVYSAARRIEMMKDLEEMGGHAFYMDVRDDNSVNECVKKIIKEQGRIDALISNAGYGTYGMIESVPLEKIKNQYDVNVFGMARAIKAVLPHMRKQKSGRIVITASVVSHVSILGLGWYASTKHALRALGVALRQEVKELGIDVVMIEPGAIKTGFDKVAFEALHKVDHPSDYQDYVDGFEKHMITAYSKCPGPESTAECIVKALTAKKPKTVYKTTTDAKMLPRMQAIMPDKMFDNFLLSSIKKARKK